MVPAAVVAMAGAVVVSGVRAARRRRRGSSEWANGRYPSRRELAARRRERAETFTEGVEFSMGRTRERSAGGGLDRWSPER